MVLIVFGVLAVTTACSDSGGDSAKAFCEELDRQRQSSSSATDADVVAALDKLVSLAPGDIKKDMEAIRSFNNLALEASSADATRSAELETSLSSASSATSTAFDRVAAFVSDKCKVDLTDGSSSFSSVAGSIN